jgi:hypothetical protein
VLKAGRKAEVVERLIATRMDRQEILTREDPPEIVFVLDEWVPHRPVGDEETRREQIRHLIDHAEQPNITVQIVPTCTGAYAGLPGAFILLSFDVGELMKTPDLSATPWRKSSRSTDTGGQCVEVAALSRTIAARNSSSVKDA